MNVAENRGEPPKRNFNSLPKKKKGTKVCEKGTERVGRARLKYLPMSKQYAIDYVLSISKNPRKMKDTQ